MITVEYRKYSLKIDGHAGGIKGSDPVCAAVTGLAYTLAANLEDAEDAGRLRELSIDMADGHAEIRCVPAAHYRGVIELLYRVIVRGLQLIAENEDGVRVVTLDS